MSTFTTATINTAQAPERLGALLRADASASPRIRRTYRAPEAAPAARSAPTAIGPNVARANKIGLFGMVSENCLERIRDHVSLIKGLHPWTAQAIYTALAVCASRQGQASVSEGQRCAVSVAELAERTGMCRRNIERYLPVLEAAGVIQIVHAHDALHRPVASHYVFTYPRSTGGHAPTQESAASDAPVAEMAQMATRESAECDSGVGLDSVRKQESQEPGPEDELCDEPERPLRGSLASSASAHGPAVPTDPLVAPQPTGQSTGQSTALALWEQARQQLQETMTEAVYSTWVAPLHVAPLPPAGGPAQAGNAALTLTCASAFARDHLTRRYRRQIETAVGGPVAFVVADGPASAPGGTEPVSSVATSDVASAAPPECAGLPPQTKRHRQG